MTQKNKLVFEDAGKSKVLFGEITKEDDFFIFFKAEDGTPFRIGKKFILSLKEIREYG